MSFTPEVVDDSLYSAIVDAVCVFKPKQIVEIGSANGLGSTAAFIEGISHAGMQKECTLYCVELNKDRYDELVMNTAIPGMNIICLNGTTVPYSRYMTSVEIDRLRSFLEQHYRDKKQYALSEMLDWKVSERKQVEQSMVLQLPRNADMVMIDGSAFSGNAEMQLFDSPKVIILDDIVDIKNYSNWQKLNNNPAYMKLKQDLTLRNGYAIFARRK